MNKYIVIGLIFFFVIGCSTYEQLGRQKYKSRIERINIGEFDGMVKYFKFYYRKKNQETLFGYVMKGQKLGAEKETDTVFIKGVLEEYPDDKIITKQFNINGYEKFTNTDSVIKIFFQKENGSFFLKNVKYYRNGKVVDQYDF